MRFPRFILERVNLKPLMPERVLDPEHALRILQRDLLKRIRTALKTQDAFSERAKKALAKSLKIEVKKSSVMVTTNHPAFMPLVYGMQSRQMRWLTKAKSPIPIITEKGELIFRSATPKSMADGRWIHPGHAPTNFMDRARKEARNYVKEKVRGELAQQLRQALRQAVA